MDTTQRTGTGTTQRTAALSRLAPPPPPAQLEDGAVYTAGAWRIVPRRGQLTFQCEGFQWELVADSNGWVRVFNGEERITEYSAGRLRTRSVAPVGGAAAQEVAEAAAGRPAVPCLESAGATAAFGDHWLLTRREGPCVDVTNRSDVYRFSTEHPGLLHVHSASTDRAISSVTLEARRRSKRKGGHTLAEPLRSRLRC